jgi:hypothetical protein
MKVKNLLKDRSRWTQGVYFRGKNRHPTDDPNKAVKFCLLGAIEKCYADSPTRRNVEDTVRKEINWPNQGGFNFKGIASWNDDKARKFSEVKALVTRLDI